MQVRDTAFTSCSNSLKHIDDHVIGDNLTVLVFSSYYHSNRKN
jgi:hypothetical protein